MKAYVLSLIINEQIKHSSTASICKTLLTVVFFRNTGGFGLGGGIFNSLLGDELLSCWGVALGGSFDEFADVAARGFGETTDGLI